MHAGMVFKIIVLMNLSYWYHRKISIDVTN